MPLSVYAATFAVLALLACLLSIFPLVVHLKARNLATTVLTLAALLLNIQNFVNALIWTSRNPDTWWNGKILCDIEVKLYVGFGIAIYGAIASLFRHIYTILDVENTTALPSPQQRRIRLAIELGLCIIMPIVIAAAHYMVQKDRYWIRTSAGCTPSYDNCWATLILIFLWPLVLCLVASGYCIISVVRLWRHRTQMSSVFSNTPGVTRSRFTRLFALAFALLVIYCPLAIYTFSANAVIPTHMYSWSYVHPPDWPERIIKRPTSERFGLNRWAQVATAYMLFIFFGLGHEAIHMYKSCLRELKVLLTADCVKQDNIRGRSARNVHPSQTDPGTIITDISSTPEGFPLAGMRMAETD
ncbi:uncharacterized protein Z518_01116 [Rhinocladiella mackenziei CBS 650.93]|uniref:Pheromone a factor receptor n=1 Tax=Rhinocladiella mackenziei CBS 650.93 TaxID=1442369 RepID=A0A0D2JKR6_9EURO|nr:uncharacterized protein Z518_01116 [Rhinocladiella mackenziei CBS 650.93]KIX10035.1 hypothetical protein Z518_01116 [Rhinocladiella mackenziei CBS 650.93]